MPIRRRIIGGPTGRALPPVTTAPASEPSASKAPVRWVHQTRELPFRLFLIVGRNRNVVLSGIFAPGQLPRTRGREDENYAERDTEQIPKLHPPIIRIPRNGWRPAPVQSDCGAPARSLPTESRPHRLLPESHRLRNSKRCRPGNGCARPPGSDAARTRNGAVRSAPAGTRYVSPQFGFPWTRSSLRHVQY